MKKLGIFALIAGLFLFSAIGVNAKTEAELKEILTQTITVGGSKYSLSDGDKVLVERYLNENEVSSAHADFIAERVETAKGIIQGQGNVDFKNYPESVKQQLKELVNQISEGTTVNATLTRDALVIYNSDNSVFAEVTKLVKQTGTETSKMAIIAGVSILIVAVGTCLVVKQVKTSE